MAPDEKKPNDLTHRLREAVQGTKDFLYLDREEVAKRSEESLARIEQEMGGVEHALHDVSESTQIAVREALGDLRGRHAEALRRLRALQAAGTQAGEEQKKSLAEALRDLQHGFERSFGR